ncbi:hypothetical protein PanWU01x14_019020, partial [Parasponia andersonii]
FCPIWPGIVFSHNAILLTSSGRISPLLFTAQPNLD